MEGAILKLILKTSAPKKSHHSADIYHELGFHVFTCFLTLLQLQEDKNFHSEFEILCQRGK